MPLIEGYEDFESFYSDWKPRAEAVGRKYGVLDPEAFSQEMMTLFYTTDYLQRHAKSGSKRTAKSWINAVIYRRVWNALRDQKRRPQKAAEYSDEIGGSTDGGAGLVETQAWAMSVRDILSANGRDTVRVWELALKQYDNDEFGYGGRLSAKIMAEDLGCSVNMARRKIKGLREALVEHGLDRQLGRVS